MHGLSKTSIYYTWQQMKRRCYDKNIKAYKDYGARGIRVCNDWLTFEGFHLWATEQGIDKNCCNSEGVRLTLERKDVDGNYEPDNCTWIPRSEQNKNRRNTIFIDDLGTKKCLLDYCRDHNLNYDTIYDRINNQNCTVEKAVSYPTKTGYIEHRLKK